MLKKTLYFSLLTSFISVSCSEDKKQEQASKDFEIKSNLPQFSTRVKNQQKTLEIDESNASLFNLKVDKILNLTLIAEIQPAEIEETKLHANDVFLAGNKLLIAYNYAGETKKGAVSLLDVSNTKKIKILSELQFPDRDINAVAYHSNNLYLAGSWQEESPSFLTKIKIKKGQFSEKYDDLALAGYAANDIAIENKQIYVTTGDNSGLHTIDSAALTQKNFKDIADARSVSSNSDKSKIYVLSGQPGELTQIEAKTGNIANTFDLGGAETPEAKSTIKVGKNWAITTLSEAGLKIVCLEDGSTLASIPPPKSNTKIEIATNAATINGNILFVAQGEAGVFVYQLISQKNHKTCPTLTPTALGSINFGEKLSANHIVFSKDLLFIADGIGGLKIISVENLKDFGLDKIDDFDSEVDESENFDL